MERSLDRDTALRILNKAYARALIKCEHYLTEKKFETASWVFLEELGTVFREYGYPIYGVRIKLSKTIGSKTKEVLETIQENEEQRKIIEKIFVEEFFDNLDNESL